MLDYFIIQIRNLKKHTQKNTQNNQSIKESIIEW